MDFSPDLVSDLPVGRCSGDCDGFVAIHQPPDDGKRGGVCLARPVGRLDCDQVVLAKRFQNLPLLIPQPHAEALGDEPVGLVSPCGAFAWGVGEDCVDGW